MQKPVVGLALGAGGARGWCHVGVLRGLAELGIEPRIIAGASMGALVGAVHAAGRLDRLEAWARALTRIRFARLLDIHPASGGLVEARGVETLFRTLDMPALVEELPIPFATVATDMVSGREIWLRAGSLYDAVRASIALPGVISPHLVGGRWLLDGGLTNPVPVSLCRALGAEMIIAVNPDAWLGGTLRNGDHARAGAVDSPREGPLFEEILARLPGPLRGFLGRSEAIRGRPAPPRYLDVVATSIHVMADQITRARLAGEPPHVLLNANLAAISVLEFYRASEAIDEGVRMVAAQRRTLLAAVGQVAS